MPSVNDVLGLVSFSIYAAALLAGFVILPMTHCRMHPSLYSLREWLTCSMLLWVAVVIVRIALPELLVESMDAKSHREEVDYLIREIQEGRLGSLYEYIRIGNWAFQAMAALFMALTGFPPELFPALSGLLAFWGTLSLLVQMARHTKATRIPTSLALLICTTPSVVYWSIDFLKEGIVFWGCCVGMRLVDGGVDRVGSIHRFVALIGLTMVSLFRPHITMALLLGVSVAVVVTQRRFMLGLVLFAGGCVAFIALAIAAPEVMQKLSSEGFTETMGREYDLRSNLGGSEIRFVGGSPTPMVSGLILILFRPFPSEVANALQALAGLEIWSLTGWGLWCWVRLRERGRALMMPLVLSSVVAILAFALQFSYCYNMGLMVRQRIMIMPVLFICIFVPDQLLRRVSKTAPTIRRKAVLERAARNAARP